MTIMVRVVHQALQTKLNEKLTKNFEVETGDLLCKYEW